METDQYRTLKTTEMSLRIVDLLDEREEVTVSEVADALDKRTSTVNGHLVTLQDREFVIQKGDVYYLSLRFFTLGRSAWNRKRLYTISDQYTTRVTEEAGFRSIFAVEEYGRGVYVSRDAGDHSTWKHTQSGERFHLHATAAGKVLLANECRERVAEIIDKWGLSELTENTITDREWLYEELETVEEKGIAYSREEQIEGIWAVSAPVLDPASREVGALSANGPAHQLRDKQTEVDVTRLSEASRTSPSSI